MTNHPNRSKIKSALNTVNAIHADYLARDNEHLASCSICSKSTTSNPARCQVGQIALAQLEVAALINGRLYQSYGRSKNER